MRDRRELSFFAPPPRISFFEPAPPILAVDASFVGEPESSAANQSANGDENLREDSGSQNDGQVEHSQKKICDNSPRSGNDSDCLL